MKPVYKQTIRERCDEGASVDAIEAELGPRMGCHDRAQIRTLAQTYLRRVAYVEAEKRRQRCEKRRRAAQAAASNPYLAAVARQCAGSPYEL